MKNVLVSLLIGSYVLSFSSWAQELQFSAVADATVKKDSPNSNYGSSSGLEVDYSPMKEAFIKFNVSGIVSPVISAKVRLYVTDQTDDGPGIYATSSSWEESKITYNNRPARTSSKLEGKGKMAVGTYVDYNVSAIVKSNGTYSFVLGNNGYNGVVFYSRSNSKGPKLIVTTSQVANNAPVVNAGSDRSIALPANSVILSAQASDSDGSIVSYSWTKVSGGAAIMASPAAASTSITGLTEGTYVFRVTVKDDKGAIATDDVQVVVSGAANVAPVVNAGADQAISLPANSVTLNAQASDSDGSIAKYSWTKAAGGAATINSPSSASTTISGLVEGSYVFRVSVTDNSGAVSSDDVVVVVNPAPPTDSVVWSNVPCGEENNYVQYMGTRWANNSNCAPYAINLSPSQKVVRFEIHEGDKRWNGADKTSPVNRDELRLEDFRPKPGTEIWIAYSLFIEEGPNTDSRWTILGQMHAGSGSPPFNFDLSPNNTIRIMTYSDQDSGMQNRAEFPITRGKWYSIVFRSKFIGQGYDGPGILEVWVNGLKMYGNTNLIMGMAFSDHNYWKIGIYRRESAVPLAVRFANLEWATGPEALKHRITSPQQVIH